jgi:1-deoxy-D-xylulose 5-phosphate reductoisomerase
VGAFLEGKIAFDEIPRLIEDAVSASNSGKLGSIQKVLEADAETRRYTLERVAGAAQRPRATSFI